MPSSFWHFFFTILGTIFLVGILITPFTLFVAATIVRQRRSPASSVTWLLTILLMPLIGIPLFWLFGTRKIERIARNKPPVELTTQDAAGPGAAHPEMARAVADLGSQGITRGNALKFHANGEEAFADLIALIDGAQKSISIETYELKGDETGRAIVDRLVARAGAGVEVRLLVDGFGSFYVPRRLLRKLRRAGAKTAFFLPIWRITLLNRSNLRDHRKIAVFDKVRVFAGGRNLANEYLGAKPDPKRWADLSFVLEGPAAGHYEEIFRYDWAFATREQLPPMKDPMKIAPGAGNAIIQVVPSGPDVTDDSIFAGMLSLIFAARQRVWIVTPYFIPSEMLAEALQIAIQRGVDVRVIVPEKSDQVLVDLARGPYLRDLQALGSIPLFYMPGMIHGKAVLIDDVAAAIGSANFDSRSMFLNFEVTSVIHSAPEVSAVEAWIKTLMAETRSMEGKVSRGRDTLEGVARLVTPML
jgi:cardiolipin synthase A/B